MEDMKTTKDQNLNEAEAFQSADLAGEVTTNESTDRTQLFADLEGEEDVSRRGENIKHFHLGGNRYQAVVYPEAVHYRKTEDDTWEEIDNNLEASFREKRSVLRNRKGPMRAEFPSVADENALIRLTRKGQTLSWRFERTMDSVSAAVKNGAELNMERLSALAGVTTSEMTIDRAAGIESPQDRRFALASKSSEVSYTNVLPGVSVKYSLTGARLKEDIILENKYALPYAALILDNGMDYLLNEDQSISVTPKGTEEALFVFTPPIAWDANHTSIAVNPLLETTETGTRLTYNIASADMEAAAYPITIDPTVIFDNTNYIQDLTLTQGASITATGNGTGNPYLKIGVSSSKENVALVRFLKLAKLKSSDTIISAQLRMASKSGSSSKYVSAHKVKIAWNPKKINYNTFLSGTADEVAARVSPDELDYSDSSTSAYMIFDLTNIYREWYKTALDTNDNPISGNFGIMLRKAARVSGAQYQEIYSAEASSSSNRPVFYVNYISHAGLEGWWQYESQSAGRAGTVHSDLFNGNMVLEHTDTQMNGNLAPVSISHYYNSCLSKDNSWRCGCGWTHSGLQRVYEKTVSSTDYYVWMDGDGTEHWFKDKGNGVESKDLEGMQLKLTRYAATSSKPPRVEIIDKEHTKMTFQKRLGLLHTGTWNDYWLMTVADTHGNKASYTYEMPSDQNSPSAMRALEGKLIKITDGAGRETTLTYTNNLLSSVRTPDAVDGAFRTVSYSYDSSSRLTGISYSELGFGTHTTYTYLDTTNLLAQATNFDGQRVKIGYEDTSEYWSASISGGSDDQMRRVISLETQAVVNGVTTYGAKQLFEYKNMCTEVTVVDAAIANATTDKKLTYQFNDSGNVTCVKDELGYAQFTKFSSDIVNSPSESSKMQKAVVNRLRMPDMSGSWASAGVVSPNTVTVNTSVRCLGIPSVKITKGNASDVCYRQQVKLEKDKSWSLSAFVKTTDFADGSGNVFLRVYDASNPQNLILLAQSAPLTTLTPTENDKDLPTDDWERLHLAFTPENTSDLEVYVDLVNMSASGSAYFSCPQLEEGVVANSFNMVSNGDFRYIVDPQATRLMPCDWDAGADMANNANAKVLIPKDDENADDEVCAAFPEALSGYMLRIPGAPDKGSANFSQDINISGSSGDVFVLGGWANAKSAPKASTSDRGFRITLKFYVNGEWVYGTSDKSKIPFNFEWVGWQYMTGVCTAPGTYSKISVFVVYMKNINTANFTNIFVHREQFAKSFGYDSKKNITSIGNLAGKKSDMKYDDYDNLISYKQPGRADTIKYTMTYGSSATDQKKHRLLTSRTPMGIKETFTYDSKGNQLTATMQKDSSSPLIKTKMVYTTDQNYVLERYDARGKKVIQATNPRTGMLTSVTDPKGMTMSYAYDGSKRVTSVQATADGKTYKNACTYENDRLKTVSHNTTSDTSTDVTYTFDYDALGSQTAVKVGTQTLSTNIYEADRARKLQRVDYGNGGKVRYVYDPFDRLTAVSYDGSDPAINPRYKYEYGANGQTAQVMDTDLNRTQWTEYDQAMRPIQANTFANDANGKPATLLYRTSLKYDKFNNLIKFQEQAEGTDHATEYNYDNDNRTTKVAFRSSGMINGMEYGYDDVNRVSAVKRGTASIGSDKAIMVAENTALGTVYTFVAGDTATYGNGATTPLVASIVSGTDSNAMNFSYTYDDVGNILSENRNSVTTTYAYDGLGQLIRVDDPHQNATWTYDYDRGGNILNKKKYALTVPETAVSGTPSVTFSYAYDATWKDKLISITETPVSGTATTKPIDYGTYSSGLWDIGNPKDYDGWTYTWNAGRQLTKMLKGVEQTATNAQGNSVQKLVSGERLEFSYDAAGLRVQKKYSKVVTQGNPTTVQVVTTDYILHGKLPTHLTQTTTIDTVDANGNVTGHVAYEVSQLHFFYDAQGRPAMVNFNDNLYTYIHNLQGDVVAIVDSNGSKVVEYKYDAWGMPLTGFPTGTLKDTLGKLNPFRYRVYIWDEETGLHYLRTRYYNSNWGRFVNSDECMEDYDNAALKNAFGYGLNNPLRNLDDDGMFSLSLAGVNLSIGDILGGGLFSNVVAAASAVVTTVVSAAAAITPVGWLVIGIGAAVIIAGSIIYAKEKDEKKKKTTKKSGKEKANDIPSWVNRGMVDSGLSAQVNATKIMNNRYGPNNWKKGPGGDFNKILKWIVRAGLVKSVLSTTSNNSPYSGYGRRYVPETA